MKTKHILLVLLASVLVFLMLIVGIGYYLFERYLTTYGVWRMNWGLDVPKPSHIDTIIDSPPSFNGDGENYYIAEYSKKKVSKMSKDQSFRIIDEFSAIEIDNLISNFVRAVNKIRNDESYFISSPVTYKQGDLYFYKINEDGSYCIAVLNIEYKKLFIMEWKQ